MRLLLGQHVDAVIFSVLPREVSRMPAMQAAQQKLEKSRCTHVGRSGNRLPDSDPASVAYKYTSTASHS